MMGYKHQRLPDEKALHALQEPGFLLKIIPDVDGRPRVCELVRYYLRELNLKGAWASPAALELSPHALVSVRSFTTTSPEPFLVQGVDDQGSGRVIPDRQGWLVHGMMRRCPRCAGGRSNGPAGEGATMRRRHRVMHLRIWIMLAGLLPAILVMAMVLKQHHMPDEPALRLSEPVAPGPSR